VGHLSLRAERDCWCLFLSWYEGVMEAHGAPRVCGGRLGAVY
jgi:hypothetical protein